MFAFGVYISPFAVFFNSSKTFVKIISVIKFTLYDLLTFGVYISPFAIFLNSSKAFVKFTNTIKLPKHIPLLCLYELCYFSLYYFKK